MDIVARAKGLILSPATEWRVIAAEPGTPAEVFRAYAVPLSAVPAVAGFLGTVLLGGALGWLHPGMRVGPISALFGAVASYLLGLLGVFVLAKLVEALAPRFGGTADPLQAMKLAAYSPTASWLAGVFAIVPVLGFLAILGLYSLYILWVGIPIVVRVPEERRLAFTLALIACAIVVNILLSVLAGLVLVGF
ncbi:YIP1 family protein [Roseomonas sp. OT10]|uniref:Yip1 family protein n=1 Tax=Roseomonas cutis TaxID=2897332 RepID=UPI001E3E0AA9|nr:Yip1 family protein [Roseomonas sp. OT10]UFN49975.1 YIP1 family protein [Roseomonas sp. OT10]